MTYDDFKEPQRVKIDDRSLYSTTRYLHGKVGIGMQVNPNLRNGLITVYFTEGQTLSMSVDPLYLVRKYD
jgi:hypothetical protein